MNTKWVLLTAFCLLVVLAGCRAQPVGGPNRRTATPNAVAISTATLTATPTPAPQSELTQAAPTPTASPSPQDTPVAEASPTPQEPAAPTQPSGGSPEPQPTETSSAAGSDCIDKAAYYGDVNIPDDTSMGQNQAFTKTWRFRNEGTCTWDQTYSLVFAGGELMNAPQAKPLDVIVGPGDIVELSVDLQTPQRGGNYRSLFEFQNPQGQRFGTGISGQELFWVQVAVSWIDQSGGITADTGAGSTTPAGESSPRTAGTAPPGCTLTANPGFEQQILSLINAARANALLSPLAMHSQLNAAAQVHSTDMACSGVVSHIGTDGSDWYRRIAAQGYPYAVALENIYVGSPDFGGNAQGAFTWWMNSPIHHDNIMNPKVTQVGISYEFNPESEYGGYYTLNLAQPQVQ